jgi:hypothetical protein
MSGQGGASATKIRDLTQDEIDRLSPNDSPNELAKKQAISKKKSAIKKEIKTDYQKMMAARQDAARGGAFGPGIAAAFATKDKKQEALEKRISSRKQAKSAKDNPVGTLAAGAMNYLADMQMPSGVGSMVGGLTDKMSYLLPGVGNTPMSGSTGIVDNAPDINYDFVKEKLMSEWGVDPETAGQLASKAMGSGGAAPNIPAQVAAQSRTSNLLGAGQDNGYQASGPSGPGSQGPIQVNTTGTQEITIRLPDIQAIVNQSISEMIYSTIGSFFTDIAGRMGGAQNFDDLQSAFSEGATQKTNQQINNTSTVGANQ